MDLDVFFTELWLARRALWQGFLVTVGTSVLAICLGSLLGTGVGLLLVYGYRPLRLLARIYTDFIRGTPVLVLVLASFYILAAVGIDLNPIQAGVFALSIFCSSHLAELLRGALLAVPRGQSEAAISIGLTFTQTFITVLFPQALRQMLPPWINTATEIVKASTLLSIIGVVELLLSTQQIISRNFLSLEFYLLAGLIYFLIDFSIERIGRFAEKKVAISSAVSQTKKGTLRSQRTPN